MVRAAIIGDGEPARSGGRRYFSVAGAAPVQPGPGGSGCSGCAHDAFRHPVAVQLAILAAVSRQ